MLVPINPDPDYQTAEQVLDSVCVELLVASDWTQIPNSPLTAAQVREWADWRQQIREFPDTWTPSDVADLPDPPL
jgi:hypothetical protein